MRFKQPSGFVVQGGSSDAYAGRCAEPVQQPLAAAAATAATTRIHQRGRFVSALVAIEAELRQVYFLFGFFAGLAGFAFFAGGLAFFTAGFAGFAALGCGLASLTGGLTAFFAMSVKRV